LDLFFATIALNLFSNGVLGVGKVWATMGYIALGVGVQIPSNWL